MCGLIGFLSADGTAASVAPSVEGSLHDMRHRGPDEGGVWHDDDAAIGFRRLSIIDIDHSHQPLPWLDGRYQLIFNGEIYNYLELRERLAREFGATFETDGDGEAIVAGYHYLGPKIVRELRGMFAFLIWDAQERVLFGARDWFGIKPLFTYSDERGTFFASEKKSLLDVAGPDVAQDVDATSLQHYLTLQYVPEPASMHTGDPADRVRHLLHAAARRASCTRAATSTPTSRSSRCPTQDKLYRQIAEALEDSVEKHMRADVTVGSFLSGGIDSTAVAALAKRHNPKLLTFTTGFEREGYSEIDVAAESAEAIGVEHITKVVIGRGDDVDAAADRLVPRRPGRRPGARPAVLHRARGPQARQGRALRRGRRRAVRRLHDLPRTDLAARPSTTCRVGPARARPSCRPASPRAQRGKDLLRRGVDRHRGALLRQRADLPPRRDAGALPRLRPDVSYMDVTRDLYAQTTHLDDSTRMQYVDLFTWLRGDILVKADKMTMANSLELRVPFLDTEVFAVGSSIPTDLKLTKETTKYALRRALELIVPAHVINRPKLGFPVPIRHWLKDEMYDWARAIITESQADELIDKDGRAAPARRAPRRPARLLPQDLDDAGVPDLARHLRRGADPARDPEPVYPVRL